MNAQHLYFTGRSHSDSGWGLGCSDLVDFVNRIDGVEADMTEGRCRVVKRIVSWVGFKSDPVLGVRVSGRKDGWCAKCFQNNRASTTRSRAIEPAIAVNTAIYSHGGKSINKD